jgi:hypothetical protein
MSEDLNLLNEIDDSKTKHPKETEFNPDLEKLKLARNTLFWLAGIFILSMICQLSGTPHSEKIFEITSHGVPPIVTLILGYYFSKT